ncbi:MAG: hypothetical protein U9Q81_01200 [Pseudomonadota bacterium]|nr:hypothetical protein [Pseudomonadota bacterium]
MRKGAIIGLDAFNPVASVVVFQFNPEKLTRTLKPQTSGGEGSIFETQRLKGAPEETIKMELLFDAADALAEGDGITESLGLYPQLSALEMLVYPKSALVITNTVLLATGTIEVIPPTGPMTLFVWGPQRIVPVQIKELSVEEQTYDSNLNPIKTKATLSLKVLSYNDLSLTHPSYWIFLLHQIAKEVFATMGSIGNISNLDDLFA